MSSQSTCSISGSTFCRAAFAGVAIYAYVDRFKTRPNVVLVNEADRAEIKGVLVRSEGYIRRNNFWVGWEDAIKV